MFYDDEDNIITEDEETIIPREYEIDFSTGQLTGKIVEGSEAVAVWAWIALQTPRFQYTLFSWNYGSELDNLIGQRYSKAYLKARTQKMLNDCLLVNPYIKHINDLDVSVEEGKVSLTFTIETEFGEETINV